MRTVKELLEALEVEIYVYPAPEYSRPGSSSSSSSDERSFAAENTGKQAITVTRREKDLLVANGAKERTPGSALPSEEQ
jgi:hypothetical protein